MAGHRIQKLQEVLRQEIALLLERDFRLPGTLLTIMGVTVSRDGLYAAVHFSVFPEKDRVRVQEMLEKTIYHTQQAINARLRMRPVPKIRFVLDTSTEQASRIATLLGDEAGQADTRQTKSLHGKPGTKTKRRKLRKSA